MLNFAGFSQHLYPPSRMWSFFKFITLETVIGQAAKMIWNLPFNSKICERGEKLYDVQVSSQFSCLPFRISSLFCIHNCTNSNGNRIKLIENFIYMHRGKKYLKIKVSMVKKCCVNITWSWKGASQVKDERDESTSARPLVTLKPKPGEKSRKFTWCLQTTLLHYGNFANSLFSPNKYSGRCSHFFNIFYIPLVFLQLWRKTRNSKRKEGDWEPTCT